MIDNLGYVYLLTIELMYSEDRTSIEQMQVNFSDHSWNDILMKKVVGFGDFRAFSNSDSPNRGRGHVILYHGRGAEATIIR